MSKTFLITAVVILILTGIYLTLKTQGSFSFIQPPISPVPSSPFPTPSPTDFSGDNVFACSGDSECIFVRADSCGCTAGGKATSINSKFKEVWEEEHPREICPAVISEDWTCINTIPKCVSNSCQLVKQD